MPAGKHSATFPREGGAVAGQAGKGLPLPYLAGVISGINPIYVAP
jgi:hypothetical protein